MDTSLDNFLDGRLKIYQPKKGFRAGIDSVLLASSVQVDQNFNILDVGCGAGVISYCIAYRCEGLKITGLEKNKDYYNLAMKSKKINKIKSKINFINADFINVKNNQYDVIVSNPPWFKEKTTYMSSNNLINDSKVESLSVDTWINNVSKNLKNSGKYYTIFPYSRINELLKSLKKYFTNVNVYPISSFSNNPPDRAIVIAHNSTKALEFRESQKIVIHNDNNTFKESINSILREGSSLLLP